MSSSSGPPQRERRPAAEAHGRERDRHREQKQRVGRRPHGLVLGDDDRERLAPVRRHGLRRLHDARRPGRERAARREGRRPPFRELLRDRGGEPFARHFRRDGQRARRGDERPVAIAQEVPADDHGSAIQRTFRRNGSAGLVSLQQAPPLGNHVARAPRRLPRGVAFERDPHEHDAEGERKGAEDQDERDQPGPERREEAPREAERDTPARRADEKERNENDERRLSRRHGGPRHLKGRISRSRESGETRGGGPDMHAAQPVRSRDGLDGFPQPAGAVQDPVGHLDALAA